MIFGTPLVDGHPMPLFYFDHFEDSRVVLTDAIGLNLRDADAARVEASRGLGDLAKDVLMTIGPKCTLEIRVRNENSEPVLVALLEFEARLVTEGP